MKKSFLLPAKQFLTYLMVFSVFVSMSSCSKSYTASFQKVTPKDYARAEKALINTEFNEAATSDIENYREINADLALENVENQVPADLTASFKDMGIAEKKADKIQRRWEKLNESLKIARTESVTTDTKELSFAERMIVKKALKKADKILVENSAKDIKNLDDAQKMDQMNRNVRIGLILILVGIVAGIFIWPIGAIVGTIGVVFLILGLLDY
jgi:hypothetical protein